MTTYLEPTSGTILNLPDDWAVEVGAQESLALVAQASQGNLAGANIVVTVEKPPIEVQVLGDYVDSQVQAIAQEYSAHNFVLLGRRLYSTEKEEVEVAVHSKIVNKTPLACFQLFSFYQDIATTVTITVPLALMDTGLSLTHHVIKTFSPAQRLYHYPFYQKQK
ncbi:hypothetical protein [Rothia nasimurium]|uniref:hypothetical protein n=1 Tax=Rothia nasimurium TaxID=85336 RepID=UPI001F205D5C|nr:hypothetical protein [Rothia nasimurium]